MNGQPSRALPDSVSTVFLALLLVGGVVGFLSGAGVLSGAGLAVFIFTALAVFVPWAIWKLNPDGLSEESAYRPKDSQQ